MNARDGAQAKFMRKNDESQAENPGTWAGVCGPTCTRHVLTLKSDVSQTVYLTAFTWGRKSIPESCEVKDDGTLKHAVKTSKMDEPAAFSFGDKALAPFDMRAGDEIKVEVEWNFTNEAHAKDWSVTAFGDGKKGSLHMTHDKGTKSDSWHPLPRKEEPAKKNKGASAPAASGKPKDDVETEESFNDWLESLRVDGTQCVMLKEETVTKGANQYSRLGIKSKCPMAVAYGISMYSDDWASHMMHTYKQMDVLDCRVINESEDIQECII